MVLEHLRAYHRPDKSKGANITAFNGLTRALENNLILILFFNGYYDAEMDGFEATKKIRNDLCELSQSFNCERSDERIRDNHKRWSI
jgi:hypothetical protein